MDYYKNSRERRASKGRRYFKAAWYMVESERRHYIFFFMKDAAARATKSLEKMVTHRHSTPAMIMREWDSQA